MPDDDLQERLDCTGRWYVWGRRQAATLSGTKVHLYCRTTADVVAALRRVEPAIDRYELDYKLASARTLVRSAKGVTLYLPRRAEVAQALACVRGAMVGWHVDGEIFGDTAHGDGVHTCFELAFDPGHDVDPLEYELLYVPAPQPPALADDRGLDQVLDVLAAHGGRPPGLHADGQLAMEVDCGP